MATIETTFWRPGFRHCQGEAHTYLIVTKGGATAREGRGLGLWFWPIGTAISEVPVNDQSVAVMFKCRTKDFQEVSIAAQVWYTVTAPGMIATRFDFSINTGTGVYNADPLTVIQGALTSAAQEAVWSHVAGHTLEGLLQSELNGLSGAVAEALAGLDFGIQVGRAVVTAVRPETSVAQALQAKTRERLQMDADAAGFERRAKATEQERAIQEAELANQLAIAKQREALIAQQDANSQAGAESDAAVATISARGQADANRLATDHQLEVEAKRGEMQLENQTALMNLRLEETKRTLALHDASPNAARSVALAKLPEGLGNVRVLTIGEGGLQSALERIADPTE